MKSLSDQHIEIGVVVPRFSKSVRILYSVVSILLLMAVPGLSLTLLNPILAIGVMVILGYLFFAKGVRMIEDFNQTGTLVVTEDSLLLKEEQLQKSISISSIKKVIMHPLLGGMARYPDQWIVYTCEIHLNNQEVITRNLTRTEIIDGKLFYPNILKTKRFDLVRFFERKKVKINFGKYDDCYH